MTGDSEKLAALASKRQRLEDIERIRALKTRYLNACDQKMPREVRDCFLDGRIQSTPAILAFSAPPTTS